MNQSKERKFSGDFVAGDDSESLLLTEEATERRERERQRQRVIFFSFFKKNYADCFETEESNDFTERKGKQRSRFKDCAGGLGTMSFSGFVNELGSLGRWCMWLCERMLANAEKDSYFLVRR